MKIAKYLFLSYNIFIYMIPKIKIKAKEFLLWSQKYTHLDMFYLASSSFWATMSFGFTTFFSIALTFTFANFLPVETYGFYKYIMSLSGALAFLTFSGMNTAVTQAVAHGHDGILPYALKFQLKWNLLFMLVSSLISGYYFTHGNNILATSLFILGVTFPFISAFNTYGAFLIGKKDFKRSSLWSVVTSAIYNLTMVGAIIFLNNIVLLVLVYALVNLLPHIYFYFRTIALYKPTTHNAQEEKALLKYGSHLSFMNIFSNLSQYVDKIVIFHFLGTIQLAIYGLALAVPERIRGYTKIYGSIILPKLSDKTVADIRPVFYKRTLQSIILGSLISLGYIMVIPIVFKIFLPKYLESIRYSQVISLSFIFTGIGSYMGSVFQSQKMLKTLYISSITAHISRIVFFILFGYLWGVWGVIYASLLVYVLGTFLNIVLWEFELRKHKSSIGNK